MGTIWTETNDGQWVADRALGRHLDGLELMPFGTGPDRGTALLTPLDAVVTVNGQRLWAGLRVLQHKDEIQAGGRRMFYSAETQPSVSIYEAGTDARPPKCAVCRTPIAAGDLVVACPGCSRLYHQSEPKPCWTYREKCAFCEHPTSLAGDAGWRPEQEEWHG